MELKIKSIKMLQSLLEKQIELILQNRTPEVLKKENPELYDEIMKMRLKSCRLRMELCKMLIQ
jgi:hypothetical protein